MRSTHSNPACKRKKTSKFGSFTSNDVIFLNKSADHFTYIPLCVRNYIANSVVKLMWMLHM